MEIQVNVTSKTDKKGEGAIKVNFVYDQVMIKAPGGGFNQESAAIFQERPFKERYDMIRTGRVVFIKNGQPMDLAEVLKGATSGS